MNIFENKYGDCGMRYTISLIGGKWNWIILWEIYKLKIIRYNQLKKNLNPITHKTLSAQLKYLETNSLIHREQYNEVPPKVEYSLTEEGISLIPILEKVAKWGNEHKNIEI
ncbi:winged helix-turn-helix transcriptional regulator [Pectinatus haikarae]|uniref:DNA-binding HxlR family transcriptional regulator n=1 Tax=Pectinatus haikarae TaxID=349096 RepID=A0ABT9YBP4_9FIRM|nr:helix-turn-helix domain-containing protein [Pectinatus haikarae]MDQ0204915.1 DNA-binding HxlR family transcriptional regulator [Pectinatus haikarae]